MPYVHLFLLVHHILFWFTQVSAGKTLVFLVIADGNIAPANYKAMYCKNKTMLTFLSGESSAIKYYWFRKILFDLSKEFVSNDWMNGIFYDCYKKKTRVVFIITLFTNRTRSMFTFYTPVQYRTHRWRCFLWHLFIVCKSKIMLVFPSIDWYHLVFL